jgi:hypothetical protein
MIIRNEDLAAQSNAQFRLSANAAIRESEQIVVRLQQIEQERATLQQRFEQLQETIRALQPLCEAEAAEETVPALGPPCYHIVSNLGRPATAPEIRNLIAGTIDLKRYNNPLAMIHMALKRMPGVNCFKGTDGKTYYAVA